MPIALIVATAGTKNVIGKNGDLPWHFSSDLKFFKEKTLGHDVLMGRTTYQSILNRLGKPLPGRRNVVLSRDVEFQDERVIILRDLSQIKDVANKDKTLFVIGGASIYQQTLDQADIIYMTHIEQDIDGDTFFPAIDPKRWELTQEVPLTENDVTLRFCTYAKI